MKVVLNRDEIGRWLKSQEMADMVKKQAEEIANKTPGEYQVSVYAGKNRVNASVYTEDEATYRDNLKNNTLLRSLGA